MDAMAYPQFDTKRGAVLGVTAERIAVALEGGVHIVLRREGEWAAGQPVDVLLQSRRVLAVRQVGAGRLNWMHKAPAVRMCSGLAGSLCTTQAHLPLTFSREITSRVSD
jgi:hypothetical protein